MLACPACLVGGSSTGCRGEATRNVILCIHGHDFVQPDSAEHCVVCVGDCGALEGKADWLCACALSFETHIDGAWTMDKQF